MPKIDLDSAPMKSGSIYPEPFASQMAGRTSLRLGDAGGLSQFGANIVILAPGAMSSQRHWHCHEDEFVMIVSGELVLIEDSGETVLSEGDAAAFPAGAQNGHHLVNRSKAEARFLVIGTRAPEEYAEYPDIDMRLRSDTGGYSFTHKDGTPYPDGQGTSGR